MEVRVVFLSHFDIRVLNRILDDPQTYFTALNFSLQFKSSLHDGVVKALFIAKNVLLQSGS